MESRLKLRMPEGLNSYITINSVAAFASRPRAHLGRKSSFTRQALSQITSITIISNNSNQYWEDVRLYLVSADGTTATSPPHPCSYQRLMSPPHAAYTLLLLLVQRYWSCAHWPSSHPCCRPVGTARLDALGDNPRDDIIIISKNDILKHTTLQILEPEQVAGNGEGREVVRKPNVKKQ